MFRPGPCAARAHWPPKPCAYPADALSAGAGGNGRASRGSLAPYPGGISGGSAAVGPRCPFGDGAANAAGLGPRPAVTRQLARPVPAYRRRLSPRGPRAPCVCPVCAALPAGLGRPGGASQNGDSRPGARAPVAGRKVRTVPVNGGPGSARIRLGARRSGRSPVPEWRSAVSCVGRPERPGRAPGREAPGVAVGRSLRRLRRETAVRAGSPCPPCPGS